MRFTVILDMINMVWSAMHESEFYSANDLSNVLEQPTEAITRILDFLSKYGFAHRITRRESIYTKIMNSPSPGDALRILRTMTGSVQVDSTQRALGFKGAGHTVEPQ
jgi:hypothetical protein